MTVLVVTCGKRIPSPAPSQCDMARQGTQLFFQEVCTPSLKLPAPCTSLRACANK